MRRPCGRERTFGRGNSPSPPARPRPRVPCPNQLMATPPDPQLYRDPWAKREAWRKHPVFSRRAMFARAFPGFGVAVVAFTTYVIAENMLTKEKKPAH
ncbi:hypothetical protein VTO73DRAFT_1805 [Trametes versicolor]